MIGITHVTFTINRSGPGWVGRRANLQNRKAVYLGNGVNAVPQRIDEDRMTIADVEIQMGDYYGDIIATVSCTPLEFSSNHALENKYNDIRKERKAS